MISSVILVPFREYSRVLIKILGFLVAVNHPLNTNNESLKSPKFPSFVW